MLKEFRIIDIKEVEQHDQYWHNNPMMKSWRRWIYKWINRTAPMTGIVLVNRAMLDKLMKGE